MLTALLTLVVTAVPMPGDAEVRRFNAIFSAAELQYGDGDFGAAIAMFRRADELRLTPEVAYDLAKCHEKLGDEAMTLFYYRQYLRRAPSANDGAAIQQEVDQALRRIGSENRGLLEVDSMLGTDLLIEGLLFPEGPAALILPVGTYDVQVTFATGRKKLKVEVFAGRASLVIVEPLRVPMLSAQLTVPAEAVVVQPPSTEPTPSSAKRVSALVLLGVGVATLTAGLVLGALGNDDASRAVDRTRSFNEAMAYAQQANGKGLAANVMFSVSGAFGLAAGVLFLWSLPDPGAKDPKLAERR